MSAREHVQLFLSEEIEEQREMFDVSRDLILHRSHTEEAAEWFCFRYSCSKGQMIAFISPMSSAVDGAVCSKDSRVWRTETGEVFGKTLRATCAFRKQLRMLLFSHKIGIINLAGNLCRY